MPIFISYSHQDKEFASRLAMQLVRHRAHIWIDQWELKVGDSIIDCIQDAIEGASAILVLLSNASVHSEWCKTELSSGLLRELEEKRVIVLPVLIEDCELPLFVRKKLYADFRTDFDDGLQRVLTAIAHLTSESSGRHEVNGTNVDWSIDWGFADPDEMFYIQLNLVEAMPKAEFTILSQVQILCNETTSKQFKLLMSEGLDWIQKRKIICHLGSTDFNDHLRLLVRDNWPVRQQIFIKDAYTDGDMIVSVVSRRLGPDTGLNVFVDIMGQLRTVCDGLKSSQRQPTEQELQRVKDILLTFRNV